MAASGLYYFGEVFTWNTCLSSMVVAGDVMAVLVVVVPGSIETADILLFLCFLRFVVWVEVTLNARSK